MQSFSMRGQERVHHVNFLQPHQRGVQHFTFICVVEAGSFSKAAEELYISAPAVIKQINSLENSLNLQLFERTHRGLIITEAGKSLYQDAKYLIQYSKG